MTGVAIVDWSHLLEDFLDNLGLSFEDFRTGMTGGWMFGYIEALRSAGCRPVLFCVSARVADVTRCEHVPTGAAIRVLPAPLSYRRARLRIPNPYAANLAEAAGELRGPARLRAAFLKELIPYLSTPLRTLARELRREQCDVILCQDYEHARFDACALLGRLTGRKVYATFQGGNWQLSRFERPLRPLSLRACAGLIVGSSVEADRLRQRYGVPDRKIARIFNPIDLRMWPSADRTEARIALGIPQEARVVAWHGRVDLHRKGLDVLAAAWKEIRNARPDRDLRLLLLGTGRDASEFRALLGDDPSVHWRDEYVNDRGIIHRHLAAADVYAFPSRNEGFPVAPVEAMACGLPVVGADAPGVADILGGEAGTIVPIGDADAFARALGTLIDDADLSARIGVQARRRAEECFSLESVGRELRAFLTGGSR
ncbi:MAG TPA: glycosyltransferase family 4 protein [Thermoanaerobaculia bacterium]